MQLWDSLVRQQEDVRVMIELGEEEADEETLKEVGEMNNRLQQGVEAAEFQRMLSGELYVADSPQQQEPKELR